MKIGLIVDRLGVARWQAEALLHLPPDTDFVIYNCTNSQSPRRRVRHAGYYVLRLLALSTRVTRAVPLPAELKTISQVDFECRYDGKWQTLPLHLLDRINEDAPALLLRFGIGLLRIPDAIEAPILSYHHGDPREFRGRPAGFYELLAGRSTVGQVIQVLSNRLDAGEVVAFGETRAYPYSYKQTMDEAYRCSPLLVREAIRNAVSGKRLPIEPKGRNYRLPSNRAVAKFVLARAAAMAKRLAYATCVEKAWQAAEAPLSHQSTFDPIATFPPPEKWHVFPTPRGYRFMADPFFDPGGDGYLVEVLNASSGIGEIVHFGQAGLQPLSPRKAHFSYPAPFSFHEANYLIPEMCEWSRPHLFRLNDRCLEDLGEIHVPGHPRLVDPTVFPHQGKLFLFANIASESLSVLRLWVADTPLGPYREHPLSPIRVSPAGSRMAGTISQMGDQILRIGQDLRGAYGDGVILFRIERLSATDYCEVPHRALRFDHVRGPHTLNWGKNTVLFDFYRDRFSPLAGIRRAQAKLASRQAERGNA